MCVIIIGEISIALYGYLNMCTESLFFVYSKHSIIIRLGSSLLD